MTYNKLMQAVRGGDIVVLDGATGTELERRGAPMDPASWCGPATLSNDKLLQQIHADYIRAGSRIVTANTFAASPLMLGAAGLADRSGEVIERAVAAARAARDATNPDVVVAGSLSHMVPYSQGAGRTDAYLLPSANEMRDAFHAVAQGLKAAGCELLMLEMMYDPDRIPAVVDAALATGLPIWFGMSARRSEAGGAVSLHRHVEYPISTITAMIPDGRVDVAGVMHSDAAVTQSAIDEMRKDFHGPLMAYPDSGYFEMPHWRFVDVMTPERYQQFSIDWLRSGVQLVGGCCGLGVAHIEAASRAREQVLAERARSS